MRLQTSTAVLTPPQLTTCFRWPKQDGRNEQHMSGKKWRNAGPRDLQHDMFGGGVGDLYATALDVNR